MDIQRLRRETEADHLAIEGTLPLANRRLEKAQYVQCLRRMYGVVAAWDEGSIVYAPDWMQTLLIARHRKHLLELDLRWFGMTDLDHRRPVLPELNDLPSLLGVMYVMEGSTLGGQLIARHVETSLHLSKGQGDAYFRGHGDRTGTLWKEFCEVLETRVSDDHSHVVVTGAKAMFKTFGEWMCKKSVTDDT